MKGYLKHKGYLGTVEFSADDNVLHGKIVGINDFVTYEASAVDELKEAFAESVDDYLQTCAEIAKEP